jgi:CheY-like chemotaxis protein
MPEKKTYRVLIVDDEISIRSTVALLLVSQGYSVATAEDGFDALLQIKSAIPDLIISDLNMPQMSGFEFLSVVRRRFPQVLVLAMSGAFEAGESVPGGVIADAFYPKGSGTPSILLKTVAKLLLEVSSDTPTRPRVSTPVWVPRNGLDSRGLPYIVLTCTDCLRSFPLNTTSEATGEVMETSCVFCMETVRFIIDFSLAVASPKIQKSLKIPQASNGSAGVKSCSA